MKTFLILWLIVSLQRKVHGDDCPRTPSYNGEKGPIVYSEAECALHCKAKQTCNGYLFKPFEQFNSAAGNTFESNCILQTFWDKNFLTDEIVEPVEDYESKVCIALTHVDSSYSERFVRAPDINVKAAAEKFGFNKAIVFSGSRQVRRFYQVLVAEEPGWPGYYSKKCAQLNGYIATPYDLEMSKQLLEELELDPKAMHLPGVSRWKLDTDLDPIEEKIPIFDNGHVYGFGFPEKKAGKTCQVYKSDDTLKNPNFRVYDADVNKWVAANGYYGNDVTKLACEFQGSGNLVHELKATYEATTDSIYHSAKNAFDGNWEALNLDSRGESLFRTITGAKNLLVITFPAEIGVQKVRILPYSNVEINELYALKNPRVLVSNTKPRVSDGTLGDPSKFKLCGHFPFSIHNTPWPREMVISIVCEKCMPFGTYVTLENGADTHMTISEMSVIGIEKSEFFK